VSESSAYTYEPGARRALGHLGRYPRHYGALALWLAAMLLVPAVASRSGSTSPIAATATTVAPPSGTVPSATSTPRPPAAPAPRTAVGAAASFAGAAASPSPSPSPKPAPAPSDDEDETDEPTPAGPGGLELPPPPPVPPAPIPEELRPVVAAVAPLTSQGCSAVGLAGVVTAVVGPAAGDAVPVASLLPYLQPAYSACATFPAPEGERTICAVDEQAREAGYPADASGLAKTPNVIGLGVDVFTGIDRAIEAMTGQSSGIADTLYETLGCHPDV
jgi:hypothetical protein